MSSLRTQFQRPGRVLATIFVALFAVLAATGAGADTSSSATAASAVLEATAGSNIEQLGQGQAGGYDWTLSVAFVLGFIGLVWMRRHIARL